jgi:Tol biopolymer transport system component
MNKRLVLAASSIALLATAASAQTAGGPPIAYVKVGGTTQEIYLANSNGSGAVRLYAAPRKAGIGSIDLRPGGNEVAFVERSSGKPSVLYVQKFTDSGAKIGNPVAVPGLCAPDYVDYNPVASEPPTVIISEVCNGIKSIISIRTDGTGRTVLQQGPEANVYVAQPRWLKDGISYVYVRALDSNPTVQQLCRNSCDGAELLWSGPQVTWMDVGRDDNRVLFNPGNNQMKMIDGDTGADLTPSPFISGTGGHFSPDGRYILYESPHSASGDYLHVYDTTTGLAPRITGKGEYGPTDWRK